MSFFGMFGGSKDEKSCDCNKKLKEHLKKCSGLGELPPLIDNCNVPKKTECVKEEPVCEKKEEPICCPPSPEPMKVPVYVPKCEVPPTLTFKCPDSSCEKKCEEVKPVCEVKVSCCGSPNNNKNADNDNSCSAKPLTMSNPSTK